MKIGFDLDNTIICYDSSFAKCGIDLGYFPSNFTGSKAEVKRELISRVNGHNQWEKLQGLVYGKHIGYAEIFPGFMDLLDVLKRDQNVEIKIISHKTIYAHQDSSKTELRKSAKNFLKRHKIISGDYLSCEQIIFCSTLDEKIEQIVSQNCEIFVDDLCKVFNHRNFPKDCRKILFRENSSVIESYANWSSIQRVLI